jgi:small subunit ribosomal protein S19e
MSNVYDVSPSELNRRVADALKGMIKRPEFVNYVKSGPGKERPPSDPDFWFKRGASILRQVYVNGPVGTSRLRTRYGNRESHMRSRKHHVRAGGNTIRTALQELEKAGLIKSTSRGRVITPNGRSFLDKISNAINATEKNG